MKDSSMGLEVTKKIQHDQIKLKFDNSSHISTNELQETLQTLDNYNKHLKEVIKQKNFDADEASLILPYDETILEDVLKLSKDMYTDTLRYIFVVGIGGSNLGTMALYNSIVGSFNAFRSSNEVFPKLIFVETLTADLIYQIKNLIHIDKEIESLDDFIVAVISKSGTTTEVIANSEVIINVLSNYFDDVTSRIVTITDKESKLWNASIKKSIDTIAIPFKVGGRYSVLSAVGLLPLSYVMDIENILLGARDMLDTVLTKPIKENIAAISAGLLFRHLQKGISINNNFFFEPSLEYVGKWYRQLMGESIGKQYNKNGEEVFTGITPIVSIGTTDLHSMAQLYFGGPRDKFTTFVAVDEISTGINVPEKRLFGNLVESIEGKEVDELHATIYKAVKKSYKNNNLPFMEVILPEICEYSIGQFLQFKMLEMMYLAKLMNVSAFDQANVEDYKSETRRILKEV